MTNSNRMILSGMQVLIDKKWMSDETILVEENHIKAIIPANMIAHHLPAERIEFPKDHFLIPGLIDLHVHGIAGHDVMDGSEDALLSIQDALAKEGVTGFLATTMTTETECIETVLNLIPKMMTNKKGAAILGIHLEGPFLAKNKMGAQREEMQRLPDVALMKSWYKLSQGVIKLVTLAPELPGAIELIKWLRSVRVIASVGHTNATYAETIAAISAGCTHATHLFNAMRGLHQREPGALGALLLSDDVVAEIIVDGLHLHPAIVELALRVKGKERLLLITDAMRATCLCDGVYDLGGQAVDVREGKATLKDGTLAGSTLRLSQAIQNMMQFTHCTLADAINMASENPARILGLIARKGSIAVGKDADLVVMDAKREVQFTMREGKVVFQK